MAVHKLLSIALAGPAATYSGVRLISYPQPESTNRACFRKPGSRVERQQGATSAMSASGLH
jgi:hypothetical protein